MIIEIKNEYSVTENKTFRTKIDVDLTDYIKQQNVKDEHQLMSVIDDYFFWDDATRISPYHPGDEDNLTDHDDGEKEFENEDEIIAAYKHLIEEVSCCDNAPYNASFCPTCGKRIEE